ncbi:MAG: signal recognition particle-docking protein FtsY [Chloroflexota bacterium]|nr:signal recognition particle-docking protein FtsY [Chloroflexota bacterium]MDQ5864361.1 signal recognition particle-docking protein FtsY [Chloroflexota bacterium]
MFNWLRKKEQPKNEEQVQQQQERVEEGLQRTKRSWFRQVASLFEVDEITEDIWEDLETLLIQADVGVDTTVEVLDRLRTRVAADRLKKPSAVYQGLQDELVWVLEQPERALSRRNGNSNGSANVTEAEPHPYVLLVVGVNGVGKTTTIAKIARYYRDQGRSVVIGAGDTFRAAAIEQLQIWGERVGAPVIRHQIGADPGAVVFDAVEAAINRDADVLIIDTAGRLHTKTNLMEELRKVTRIISKQLPGAPHETLLVLDATTGQNGLQQAKAFTEVANVTDLAVAKLDGTAKGGVVFAIAREMNLPIRYIGTGEKITDLAEFDARQFVSTLFS